MKIISKTIDWIFDEEYTIVIKKKVSRNPKKKKLQYRKRTQAEIDREREDKMYRRNWRISNSGSKAKSQKIANLNLKYGV